jgi:hypothetical protein
MIGVYFATGAVLATVAAYLYHIERAGSIGQIARVVLGMMIFGVIVGVVGPIMQEMWSVRP